MNLSDYLQSAQRSLFRFEGLQTYDVPQEKEAFEEFVRTGQVDTSDNQDWYEFLKRKHREGVITQRVRLIDMPLTDYTRFELPFHQEAIRHGDDIRSVTRASFDTLQIPLKDFWIVDDEIVLLMNYDPTGKWLGFDAQTGHASCDQYIVFKQQLLKSSTLLSEFND